MANQTEACFGIVRLAGQGAAKIDRATIQHSIEKFTSLATDDNNHDVSGYWVLTGYPYGSGSARQIKPTDWPYRQVQGTLNRKLVSTVGRVDYARVRIQGDQIEPLAISGASILSSTTRADGFVIVPADSEGFPAGAIVNVILYD